MRVTPDSNVVALTGQLGAAGLKSARCAQKRKPCPESACFGDGVGVAEMIAGAPVTLGVAAAAWTAFADAPAPTAGIMTRLGNSDDGRWAAGTADDGVNGEAQLVRASATNAAAEKRRSEGVVILMH